MVTEKKRCSNLLYKKGVCQLAAISARLIILFLAFLVICKLLASAIAITVFAVTGAANAVAAIVFAILGWLKT